MTAIYAGRHDQPGEFVCSFCGTRHGGLPFSYGAPAPAYWHTEFDNDPNSLLADEQCVIWFRQFRRSR